MCIRVLRGIVCFCSTLIPFINPTYILTNLNFERYFEATLKYNGIKFITTTAPGIYVYFGINENIETALKVFDYTANEILKIFAIHSKSKLTRVFIEYEPLSIEDWPGKTKFGYVDENERLVIDYRYDRASNFHNNYALVNEGR